MKAICLLVAVAAFFMVLPQGAFADSTSGTLSAQCMEHQASAATCPHDMSCCAAAQTSSMEQSHPRGIGRLMNNFFAFGCRVNYRLTDWTLSDKCALPRTPPCATSPERCGR
jgi:hypothetical protein